ncbi:hypothetical protein [Lysobacter gummosus]|uniref:hypothetical protein n=1 Tax=Lysobacter gummosus TaxID=262324 RepID=UPI003635FD42
MGRVQEAQLVAGAGRVLNHVGRVWIRIHRFAAATVFAGCQWPRLALPIRRAIPPPRRRPGSQEKLRRTLIVRRSGSSVPAAHARDRRSGGLANKTRADAARLTSGRR